jgi:hypothetical protein
MALWPIHVLNSLLYAATLFLIAGGLSLIYGVMRIVNLATAACTRSEPTSQHGPSARSLAGRRRRFCTRSCRWVPSS